MNFKCACCDEIIEGIPTFAWIKPLSYFEVPEDKREKDVVLTEDVCIIADKWFFVRGCIEIPVHGSDNPFIWGVWVSLSEKSFDEYQRLFDIAEREQNGPYFGWLNHSFNLDIYPETENLKTMVHLRNNGIRPFIELEATDHPLAIEQKDGISLERVAELYSLIKHK